MEERDLCSAQPILDVIPTGVGLDDDPAPVCRSGRSLVRKKVRGLMPQAGDDELTHGGALVIVQVDRTRPRSGPAEAFALGLGDFGIACQDAAGRRFTRCKACSTHAAESVDEADVVLVQAVQARHRWWPANRTAGRCPDTVRSAFFPVAGRTAGPCRPHPRAARWPWRNT